MNGAPAEKREIGALRSDPNLERRHAMLLRKTFVLVGLPLLIGGAMPAFAQDSNAAGDAAAARADQPAQSERQFDPVARVQKRLDHLKAKLQIAPEQEQQWSAFANTVLAQVQQMKQAREAAQPRPTTAPERIDQQLARMKERTARFEAVADAAKGLYANLTPEQRQIADERLLNFRHGHHG
jgi:periplasmic protein CpxP/Spy